MGRHRRLKEKKCRKERREEKQKQEREGREGESAAAAAAHPQKLPTIDITAMYTCLSYTTTYQ